MERILSMIGLAKKAGLVEIGEEPVGSAARAKHARVILVAGDAAASSVRRAYSFAQSGLTPQVLMESFDRIYVPQGSSAYHWLNGVLSNDYDRSTRLVITAASAGCAIPFGLALIAALKGEEKAKEVEKQIVIR